jgi:NAD(P) transhydrogenase
LGLESEHHKKQKTKLELPDMKRLLARRDRVVDGETQVISDQLKRNGIQIIHGRAKLVPGGGAQHPPRVEVEHFAGKSKTKKTYEAEIIILAVGARPVAPPHLLVDGELIHDSDTILTLKKVPKSMVVLGAGVIGCEYASMFSMAGTHVSLVDKRKEILASVDREIVSHLVDRFKHQGMDLILDCEAVSAKVIKRKSGKVVELKLNTGKKIVAEAVLVAQGRAGNTESLGTESVGVKLGDRGLVTINRHFQSSIPSVYAVGDVVGAPALASTSMEQGRIAVCHAFNIPNPRSEKGGGLGHSMPEIFPYGIYTIPEISMVGKTEEDLVKEGASFVVGRARYKEMARGQIVGDRWGILKMLVDQKTFKLLGVHIIGDNAADLIHIGQAVMTLGGDVHYFIQSVFNYPTLAEAYKTSAFHALNQILGLTKTR